MNLGYARVSTRNQHLDRQYEVLKHFVSDERYIYCDKASGKDMERTEFQNLLKAIREGDTLYIKSLDRLGRNKSQIKQYLEYFKQNHIQVKILDMPTTMQEFPEEQNWIGEMINTILIEVYSTLAQQERLTLLQRQAEGIAAAKAKGKHLGRPVLELPKEWSKLYGQWKNGQIKTVEFMAHMGMKKSTFYKKVKDFEATLKKSGTI
ncbi:recombinase family protein [Rummeliibacillus suwonensis]|uniref:recombinase family protein n=1 Tax=Rummeliibacillus suwonensis TaxID=1306154 RepID=UPI00289C4B2D|nr:recombinase family protein [Rummeliibacillus suwonensis]